MRRRRAPAAAFAAAALLLATTASAAQQAPTDSAADIRQAIVAAAAYAEDHGGSYVGMTAAKLRRYVNVRNVTVRRATRRSYCLQSIRGRLVHFDGPRGKLRYGRCGVRGALVPPPPPAAPAPQPTGDAATAQRQLKTAAIAAMAFYADSGTYAGMTLAKLQAYDKAVTGIAVEWTRPNNFCFESTVGAETHHLLGVDFKAAPGPCPAPPV